MSSSDIFITCMRTAKKWWSGLLCSIKGGKNLTNLKCACIILHLLKNNFYEKYFLGEDFMSMIHIG